MKSNREYERVGVDRECVLFFNNGQTEVNGILKDISENGVAFICEDTEELRTLLSDNIVFSFWTLDNYEYFDIHKNDSIIGVGRIIRFDDADVDNKKILGCKLISPDRNLLDYISRKKVSVYMKTHDLTYGQ